MGIQSFYGDPKEPKTPGGVGKGLAIHMMKNKSHKALNASVENSRMNYCRLRHGVSDFSRYGVYPFHIK